MNIAVGLSGQMLLFAKSMVKSVFPTTLHVKRVWCILGIMQTVFDVTSKLTIKIILIS